MTVAFFKPKARRVTEMTSRSNEAKSATSAADVSLNTIDRLFDKMEHNLATPESVDGKDASTERTRETTPLISFRKRSWAGFGLFDMKALTSQATDEHDSGWVLRIAIP